MRNNMNSSANSNADDKLNGNDNKNEMTQNNTIQKKKNSKKLKIFKQKNLNDAMLHEMSLKNKSCNTIASKMKQVVDKLIENQKNQIMTNNFTVFIYKSQQSELISSFLQEIRKENVGLYENKEQLFHAISEKYESMK